MKQKYSSMRFKVIVVKFPRMISRNVLLKDYFHAYLNIMSIPALENFSQSLNGKQVSLYILKNSNNMQAVVTNYGARWISMLVPDSDGNITDIVTGFDSLDGFIRSTEAYYGAVVGRYANRIAKGKFNLHGKEYQLAVNNPPNHLHGGVNGFHTVVWDVVSVSDERITMKYYSVNGEEGYPGNLDVTLTYRLNDDNEFIVEFGATTDDATVINLTQHAYFNLNGQGTGTILNHTLRINASNYTPIDETSIPTGLIESVEGTPFDFTSPRTIGLQIGDEHDQIKNGSGYDHNFVLNDDDAGIRLAATAIGDKSGIQMDVYTDEPGIQLYTGNFMNNENVLKGGARDGKQEAFCLETQHFPDSPNRSHFPSVVLLSGDVYKSTTIFKFSVKVDQ